MVAGALGSFESARPLSVEGALVALVWFAHLMLAPIYVFNAGLPQPADFLVGVLFLLLLLFRGLEVPRGTKPVLVAMTAFVFYVAVVDAVWWLKLRNNQFLIAPLYYVFNLAACLVFLAQYHWFGRSFLKWTVIAIFCSVLFQFLVGIQLWGFQVGRGIRVALFFRNPNQTAYYAVLCGSIVLICSRLRCVPQWAGSLLLPFYAMLCYIVATSESRAGLAAVAMLILLQCLRGIGGILLGFALILVASYSDVGGELRYRIMERIEQKNKSFQEELTYRGYARIWRQPEYLAFGAGEGAYDRFDTLRGHELHSTFGNVLMSYGVAGSLLLVCVFWMLGRQVGWLSLLYLFPVWIFGLTHNGIRHTEFWLLPLVLWCAHRSEEPVDGRLKQKASTWGDSLMSERSGVPATVS